MADTRDYYADLELSPSADVQEIKKQFRKLALKYHPDRNPGREQEVNAQFQIIQHAHEVLSDPEQKAKYDVSRTRSKYPTSSGVKGNPWSNVSAQYPPPPRRNAPNRAQAPPPPPSGAQRWQSRFSSGVPPTAKQTADSEAKKNAARAFENMRKGGSSTREPRAQPPPPPPRTESARQRQQASFGARKPGFQPRSGVPGDEPPVVSNNYTRRPDPERYAYATHETRRPVPPVPDPLSQFRDQEGSFDARQRTPYMSHGGEKTDPFDGIPLGRTNSTRQASRTGETSSSEEELSARQRSASAPKAAREPATPRKPVPNQEPQTAERPQDARPKAPLKKTRSNLANAQKTGFDFNAPDINGPTPTAPGPAADPKAPNARSNGTGSPSIFSFPVNEETFAQTSPEGHRFARSSTDDINTSFVDDEDSSTWKFSAGGAEDTQPKSRSQSGSRTGRRSPIKRPPSHPAEPPVVPPEAGKSDGSFNREDWSDKFGPQTFVPQAPPSQPTSPTKSSRASSRKPKPAKAAGGGAVVVDDSSDEEVFEWRGRKTQAEPEAAPSPQAMDIDSPPAGSSLGAQAGTPVAPSPSPLPRVARNINVEPSRPEWRPGSVEATNGDIKPGEPAKKEVDPNTVGSEDSEEFRASLADLKNVPPFAQQRSGLESFADLKDTIPFESKASADIPIKLPKPTPLQFPNVPVAPNLPSTVLLHGVNPNTTSWEKYVKEFEAYLRQWDAFNAQVVDHFATRKAHILRSRGSKGYAFLEARDNTDIQEYYNWVQQDIDVRKRWAEACEEHQQRLREFMAFRQKMK